MQTKWIGSCSSKSLLRNVWKRSHLEWYAFLSPSMSPGRSWVQRKSTTCWWPPASTRSWKLSGKSFTTACWRPEMWTVSSPQVHSFPVPQMHAYRNAAHIGSLLQKKNVKYNLFFLFQHGSRVRNLQLTDSSVCSDQTVSRGDVSKHESRLFNCVLQFVALTVFIWKTLGVSFGCNTRKLLTSLPCWNRVMHIQPAWLLKQTQRLRLHHTQSPSCYITVQNIISLFCSVKRTVSQDL